MGLRPGWEEQGCLRTKQQGGAARGKSEDEVDVSCVQLSDDRRSISEDSGGKELHVQDGGFLVRFLLDDLEDDHWCSLVLVASFPVTVSWEDCPFLFAYSWLDFHELTTYMWVYSWALFFPLVHVSVFVQVSLCWVTPALWCSLKSKRKMPPDVSFLSLFGSLRPFSILAD